MRGKSEASSSGIPHDATGDLDSRKSDEKHSFLAAKKTLHLLSSCLGASKSRTGTYKQRTDVAVESASIKGSHESSASLATEKQAYSLNFYGLTSKALRSSRVSAGHDIASADQNVRRSGTASAAYENVRRSGTAPAGDNDDRVDLQTQLKEQKCLTEQLRYRVRELKNALVAADPDWKENKANILENRFAAGEHGWNKTKADLENTLAAARADPGWKETKAELENTSADADSDDDQTKAETEIPHFPALANPSQLPGGKMSFLSSFRASSKNKNSESIQRSEGEADRASVDAALETLATLYDARETTYLIDSPHTSSDSSSGPVSRSFDKNTQMWNIYAVNWRADEPWVQELAGQTHGGGRSGAGLKFFDKSLFSSDRHLATPGDEWSSPNDLKYVYNEYIAAYAYGKGSSDRKRVVADLGCRGGRLVSHVVRSTKLERLYCFDQAEHMVQAAQASVGIRDDIRWFILKNPFAWPSYFEACFDFVYAFDMLLHMDLHLINLYIRQMSNMLRPGGFGFFSVANIASEHGWARFSMQTDFTVGGFYFLSKDMVEFICERNQLRLVKTSDTDPKKKNIYVARDLLCVVQRVFPPEKPSSKETIFHNARKLRVFQKMTPKPTGSDESAHAR